MKLGRKRCVATFASALIAAGASAPPAGASVTIGQLDPGTGAPSTCSPTIDLIQPTVTSGSAYVAPGVGTITSWSHSARSAGGQTMAMKVFRKFAEPAFYEVVGHDGPRPLASGVVNTFPASIPVMPGDVLGLQTGSGMPACLFDATGESLLAKAGNLADGQSGAFTPVTDFRLNASAVFVPSNVFTLGKARLNKKKGIATLSVTVPNPGTLTASGKGVKAASAAGAVISKTVAAGTAKLVIKAKGKQAKTLKKKGKVKLKPKITYTPTGGDPASQSKKLKLKRKLKRKKR